MAGLLVRSRRRQETGQQAEVQSLQRVCGQNKRHEELQWRVDSGSRLHQGEQRSRARSKQASWWLAKRRRLAQSERKEYRPRRSQTAREESTLFEIQSESESEDMLEQWDELMNDIWVSCLFFVWPDICVICPIISCYARTFVHTCKRNYFDLCMCVGSMCVGYMCMWGDVCVFIHIYGGDTFYVSCLLCGGCFWPSYILPPLGDILS